MSSFAADPKYAPWKQQFPRYMLLKLAEHSAENPTKLALLNAHNAEDSVTYGDLRQFVLALSSFLEKQNFNKGDIACVCLPNCWEYAGIFLAVGLRRGVLTGANPLYKKDEYRRQFLDSGCKIVFCSSENVKTILEAASDTAVETFIVVGNGLETNDTISKWSPLAPNLFYLSEILQSPTLNMEKMISTNNEENVEDELLLLAYSSGTTGTPKGVMINNGNFNAMIDILGRHFAQHIYPYMSPPFNAEDEVELLLLPFYHCYGFGMLIDALLNGSTGVVIGNFSLDLFCNAVQSYKIRILKIVPSIVVSLCKSPKLDNYDFTHVSVLISGAAPVGKELLELLHSRLPQVKLAQGYGMTEMTFATHLPVLDDQPRIGSAGKLLSMLEMKIVDPSDGKEVALGERGELLLRGPTRMVGYWNRPVETAQSIDSDGWLKTGDIVYRDEEGFIYIVDRLKELIKVSGFQVAPAELEDLLLQHPGVDDCAVIGVAASGKSAGEVPKAFVVRNANSPELDEAAIQHYVKEHVIFYKELKGGVQFVEQIPKSKAGKILRKQLRDI